MRTFALVSVFLLTQCVAVSLSSGAVCRDGTRSLSRGRGTCSWHGGVRGWRAEHAASKPIAVGGWVLLGVGLFALVRWTPPSGRRSLYPSIEPSDRNTSPAPATLSRPQEPVQIGSLADVSRNEVLQNKGAEFLSAGRYVEAAAVLQEEVQLRPNSPITHYNLGVALIGTNDFCGATQSLKIAVDLAPNDPDAWLWYGVATNLVGSYATSVSAFERAIDLRSQIFGTFPSHGKVYEASRSYKRVSQRVLKRIV
jgi:hypothetical protein